MVSEDQYSPKEYWESRLNNSFDLTGVGQKGFDDIYNLKAYKARIRVLDELLKEMGLNPRDLHILDIGVGTGFYIDFWEKLGAAEIVGLDISGKSVSELKTRYPQYRFIEADISDREALVGERTFDIITAFDVFFHIVDEKQFQRALGNIRSLAHEDSVILILDVFSKSPVAEAAAHVRFRTYRYYQKALNASGMEIKRVKPVFYFLATPVDIDNLDSKFQRNLVLLTWRLNTFMAIACRKLGLLGRVMMTGWSHLLYRLERIALKHVTRGPSSKLAEIRLLR